MTGLRRYERDALLPGRLGDAPCAAPPEDLVASWVRSALARPEAPAVVGCEWEFARWKPGVSITCVYRLRFADGKEELVVLRRYRRERASTTVERDRRADEGLSHLWPRAFIDASTVLFTPWADRALPGLGRLFDPRRAARWLEQAELVPARAVRRRRTRCELARYKPKRRGVVRLDVVLRDDPAPRRSFAVRALPVAEARRVAPARRALGSGAPVVPLSAALVEAGLLFEPWLAVTALPRDSFEHAEAAGRALALLHAFPPPRDVPCRARDGGRQMLHGLGLEHAHVPVPSDALRAFVHGDFHADQVVLDDRGEPLLMDLDCAGPGDPRRDLASWVADRLVLDPGLAPEEAAEPLLRGYGAAGGERFDLRALAPFAADELVARAAAALRRLEQDALPRARLLLETAARLSPPVRVPASGGGLAGALERLAHVPLQRASPASVIRVDVSSAGQIFLCLGLAAGERWFRNDPGGLVPLDPSADAALPLSARLRSGAPASVLSYRPGRRLVLRTESEVLKGYRAARLEDAARAHAQARALNARRGFRVAALRELLPDHAALALEPLAGVPVPVRGRSVEAFLNVGARLRAMQDGPVTGLRRFGAEDELAVLLQWRERAALAEVAPPEGFEEACRELAATAPGLPEAPPVPCHRDLHDGQLLLTPQGVALLDFDLLCAGDAALDPANLLAHLHLRALQGEEGADENAAHACGEALLEGLDRSEEEGFSIRLRFYQATASLRLALVYGLRPRWAHLSATLVRLGRRALADARRGAAR